MVTEAKREYMREYHQRNKEVARRNSKAWRKRNPERRRELEALYRERHRDGELARHRLYRENNRLRIRAEARKHNMIAKVIVLRHYSLNERFASCVRCGMVDVRCLTIDHINGGGNKHRKTDARANIYRYLRKRNYPPGYQTMCMNCQLIKRYEKDENSHWRAYRKPGERADPITG